MKQIDDETKTGALRTCDEAYSARVAGVVSGANDLAAGIELGKGEPAEQCIVTWLTGKADQAHQVRLLAAELHRRIYMSSRRAIPGCEGGGKCTVEPGGRSA